MARKHRKGKPTRPVSIKQLKGTNKQIAEQIAAIEGRILATFVVVEEAGESQEPLSDEQFMALMKELQAGAVSVGHVDDSREAIYTRMPGE